MELPFGKGLSVFVLNYQLSPALGAAVRIQIRPVQFQHAAMPDLIPVVDPYAKGLAVSVMIPF
ncbi:MAG: hypothetical protein JJE42_12495 [Burkholderiales bacterium]|nr:hypothetical protein [Burkholderiales bacterium]